ncbi:protein OSB3, chloroplastic/mitochondrial [Sesamum indicum]|uniref:Protein OSB3, chloroplastic/mitochondrial n=1 Tax=Sesamum indicum TaxID=4182 RepID=A0A6I9T1P6_SESIN|nr:protein OSB3, chloroplastic/mitochondrial [Sesamum indicum]
MSLLARAKLSARRRLLLHPITALQHSNFYSTHVKQKAQQLSKPRTQKSSSGFPQRTGKQDGPPIVWPKPREIPYQAKVANFVNLIGYVTAPVRFEVASDGKHLASTVISEEISGGKNSFLIPVVFEGDLAHVVACHVKEKDCVFVSGQLNVDPLRFGLSESLGRFLVLAENLNFVEGLGRNDSATEALVSFSGVEIDKPVPQKSDEVTEKVDNDEDFNQQWREALEHAKEKRISGVKDDWASGVYASNSIVPELQAGAEIATLEHDESKTEKGNENNGENANKKKDRDSILDLWVDLVQNSLLWWDYRHHKSNGLVKEKFPDFKRKVTGEALWINTAPKWVLPGLENLEFDVKDIKGKQVQGGEGPGERKNDSKEDSWKNLVEYPNKWWDNRVNKRYPKSPDFKHKETGDVLWLSDIPDWALSRLPPLRDGRSTSDGKRNTETL